MDVKKGKKVQNGDLDGFECLALTADVAQSLQDNAQCLICIAQSLCRAAQ
jgi:hypothetical protein